MSNKKGGRGKIKPMMENLRLHMREKSKIMFD
jgi:hypothetical protein